MGREGVIRNRVNAASAVFVQGLLLAGLVAADPLRLTTGRDLSLPPSDRQMDGFWFLTVSCMALGAVASFGFLWTPRVMVEGHRVTIVNPLRRYVLDSGLVSGLDLDGGYPAVRVGGIRIVVYGAEQSLGMQLRRARRTVTALQRSIRLSADPSECMVQSVFRRPERPEVAIAVFWLLVVLVALARWIVS